MTLTYGEARSNAEKIADEELKARVINGIELLTKEYGPEWPDLIDPSELLMCNPAACILGQLYDNHQPTDEQWHALYLARGDVRTGSFSTAGYWKGLAILNSDAALRPYDYGFDIETAGRDAYEALDEAWMIVLTGEDE